jgi:hypothetical protein
VEPAQVKPAQIIKPEPKPQPVAEPAKKVKPEMKDAITQTDRSDYQLIKAKLMREKALKAQLEQTANSTLSQRKISDKQNAMKQT